MMATNTMTLESVRYCPACQSEMELEIGPAPSTVTPELSWFHVDVYRCPCCGRRALGGPFFGD